MRLVYNKALQARTDAWTQEQRHVTHGQTSAMLTAWKKTDELAFLREVSCVPLQQALRHLHAAFGNFFARRAGRPRFKTRKNSRAAAEYTRSGFRWHEERLTLAKMRDPLAVVWSRPLPEGAQPSSVTVSRDCAGRWFVSLLVETSVDHHHPAAAAVGVDAGVTALVTLSTGERIANPRHEQQGRERLARAQRVLARKQKGSANREKARRKVGRLYARVADCRRDFLHKLSTRLVRENQTIVIEDLNVTGMLRNGRLARQISDASWSQLRSVLAYKAAWHGRKVIAIDQWYPSSKVCSACGARADEMPLRVRKWTCRCGVAHDRDVNAAKNILAAGLAVTACGDGVRPNRHSLVRQLSRPPS